MINSRVLSTIVDMFPNILRNTPTNNKTKEESIFKCPQCGSTNIEAVSFSGPTVYCKCECGQQIKI